MTLRFAAFVTPHGFGHAARASAVMEALYRARGDASFDIYTRVPAWFFAQSLTAPFEHHDLTTDVGLAQRGPLDEDLDETLRRLDAFVPLDEGLVGRLADELHERGAVAALCDISPLGIAAAQRAGIPSVLIENFTWDWIYDGYEDRRLAEHARWFEAAFAAADHHIQCEPVCAPVPTATGVPPICRPPRHSREGTRASLGIPPQAPMVLLSMGGTATAYTSFETLASRPDAWVVVPGGAQSSTRKQNLLLLPKDSEFFHPDLVLASDVVVGKLGYSTVAEVHHAGVPLAFIDRPRFAEAAVLARFAREHLACAHVPRAVFDGGHWLEPVLELATHKPAPTARPNGAMLAARSILSIVG